MNWLSIDTSMNACGVAVRTSDGQEFKTVEEMQRGQSERLMPMIQDVIAQAKLTLPKIDSFAVTNGPGAFTGLRIGLSIARTLGLVSQKPVIGISTFDALYNSTKEKTNARNTCVLIETKRSDYYVQVYDSAGTIMIDGACIQMDELKTIIQDDWVIVGDSVERLKNEITINNDTHHITCPNPISIIDLAVPHIQNASSMPDPLYLRGADVSVSRQKTANII